LRGAVSRGLFVGRFQPFHLGHLEAARYAMKKVEQMVVVIGSAQYSHTVSDPFTAGERVMMIKAALDEARFERSSYFVIPVEDINYHCIWVDHIKALTPSFSVVFSNESLTKRLFKEAGMEVEPIPFFSREKYSATEIRSRMLDREDWESLVPNSVAKFIKEVEGVQRIQELALSDKPNSRHLV
jgi:nicotinamide-nucleotide adenylyltransferase